MARFGFIGKRLIQMAPVVVGVTIVAFFLIHLIPGNPVVQMLGDHYTPRAGRALSHQLGLDKPLWDQYIIFMTNLLHANLGQSIYYQQPVLTVVLDRVEPSLWLIAYGAILAAMISLPLAVYAALHPNGPVDQLIRVTFIVGVATPGFFLGILLQLVFSVKLHLFPTIEFGTNPVDHLYHLFLPALTIALSFSAVLIRSLRNSMLSVLEADYVDTARMKGLKWRTIVRKHVLRNALLSTVTIFGVNVAFLVGSIVIVENVFALGGIGQLLLSSVQQRDYGVVQGITLLIAIFIVAVNLLTDMTYAVLDPRVAID